MKRLVLSGMHPKNHITLVKPVESNDFCPDDDIAKYYEDLSLEKV